MAQYMISVMHDPADDARMAELGPDAMQQIFTDVGAFNERAEAEGVWVFAGGLMPKEQTYCVDGRDGDTIVSDGPYSEAKEYLGGFWVLELADDAAAREWAAAGSKACQGKVEVRPFQAEPGADGPDAS